MKLCPRRFEVIENLTVVYAGCNQTQTPPCTNHTSPTIFAMTAYQNVATISIGRSKNVSGKHKKYNEAISRNCNQFAELAPFRHPLEPSISPILRVYRELTPPINQPVGVFCSSQHNFSRLASIRSIKTTYNISKRIDYC